MYDKSIELLNKAIADELHAVHQYMYFHFLLDDMGYDLLAGLFKRTAIDEMMHVEKLAERILFLKGEVEMKVGGEVEKIKDVAKMLEKAAGMEQESAKEYNVWANELLRMRIQLLNKFLKDWYPRKKDIMTSMILKQII